jgi:hypothetical protein
MGFFSIWLPWMFRHVIVFHILVVVCCSNHIPFDNSSGLPIVALCLLLFCFVIYGVNKKKVYCCALERFVVVDE